jgi:hypothetical protein
VDLCWTFSIMEKNNVIWPGFTAYKLYGGPTGQRTVVSTQNLTKVADERSYGTIMTSETYLMPLTMI